MTETRPPKNAAQRWHVRSALLTLASSCAMACSSPTPTNDRSMTSEGAVSNDGDLSMDGAAQSPLEVAYATGSV